ncbi:MAG: hypothetical protein ACR2M4_06360 [Actinomycetota bacterium]
MRKGAMIVRVLCIAMGASVSAAPAYLVPVAPGWRTRALITVGESVNDKPDGSPYRMVGIPDGLGAYDNHDGTFTVLMNHELREVAGVRRAHGGIGAFVSQWTIRKHDLKVLHGATSSNKSIFGTPALPPMCSPIRPPSAASAPPIFPSPMLFSTARAGTVIPAECS